MGSAEVERIWSPEQLIERLSSPNACEMTVVAEPASGFRFAEQQIPEPAFKRVHRVRELVGDEPVVVLLRTWVSEDELPAFERLSGGTISVDEVRWLTRLWIHQSDDLVGFLMRKPPAEQCA